VPVDMLQHRPVTRRQHQPARTLPHRRKRGRREEAWVGSMASF
jgi:hypothetical protein